MAVKETQPSHNEVYWRFNVFHRFIHLVMMVTFIGLALTGLPLKYSDAFWAKGLVGLWGGAPRAPGYFTGGLLASPLAIFLFTSFGFFTIESS